MSRLAIRLGVGWRKERKQDCFQEVGGRFKREGIYVYMWLTHVAVRQKPTQHCKAITLQLKRKFKKFNAMNFKFAEIDFCGERAN